MRRWLTSVLRKDARFKAMEPAAHHRNEALAAVLDNPDDTAPSASTGLGTADPETALEGARGRHALQQSLRADGGDALACSGLCSTARAQHSILLTETRHDSHDAGARRPARAAGARQPQPTAVLPAGPAEEHQARLRAEADAVDKATRLRVAQEQLAEYADEKSEAAAAILQQAEAVEQALAQLLASGSGSAGQPSSAVLQQLQKLKQQLADAALEARAFSEQQQQDVERLKRSSMQVRAGWCKVPVAIVADAAGLLHTASVAAAGLPQGCCGVAAHAVAGLLHHVCCTRSRLAAWLPAAMSQLPRMRLTALQPCACTCTCMPPQPPAHAPAGGADGR